MGGERTAVDDQADALEAGRGLMERLGRLGEGGVGGGHGGLLIGL
jgi:hypothetical protein